MTGPPKGKSMPSMALSPYNGGVGDTIMANSHTKAAQTCHSCRKQVSPLGLHARALMDTNSASQKRKCDKVLPSCSLCLRMSRICDYSDTAAAPTAEDLAALQHKLVELETRLTYAPRTPDLTFGGLASSNASGSHCGHTPQSLPQETLWLNAPTGFPAVFFLDSRMHQKSSSGLPNPIAEIPSVSAFLAILPFG